MSIGKTDKKWKGHLLTEETDTELIEERYGLQKAGQSIYRKVYLTYCGREQITHGHAHGLSQDAMEKKEVRSKQRMT